MSNSPEVLLFCHRCGSHLTPGKGSFYVARIEAFADPTGPNLDECGFPPDIGDEIDRLIDQMAGMSEQELMDQVYRRVTIHLCLRCYESWIENPAAPSDADGP